MIEDYESNFKSQSWTLERAYYQAYMVKCRTSRRLSYIAWSGIYKFYSELHNCSVILVEDFIGAAALPDLRRHAWIIYV